MKTSVLSLIIAGVVLSLTGSLLAADKQVDQATRDRFEQRTKAINNAAGNKGQMKIAQERIATETGVPLDQVQSLHQRYPKTGAAGLLSACVMAAETKKSPESFLKQRANGKSWESLARDNNVSIEKLNDRLGNLERSLTTNDKSR